MTYVLIITIFLSSSTVTINTVDFEDERKCKRAALQYKQDLYSKEVIYRKRVVPYELRLLCVKTMSED